MNVGIIGSGSMGSGIAQVAATAGCQVKVFDTSAEAIKRSMTQLEKILSRLIEKGRIDQNQKTNIQSAITYVDDLSQFADSDLVIEAIIENPEIKKSLFSNLEKQVPNTCVIATNTSSLSVTDLASSLHHPERFIGIHFFNPAPLMKLVEIVPAVQTSAEICEKAQEIIAGWGKHTVVAKDTPGFIVNKVARPFYSEALRIYEEGIADFATIDWAIKNVGGFRMGPFELMDFIGNDVNYTVTETVFKAFYYDPRYKPSFTQKRLAEAGYLGRKTGRGFYDYSPENMNSVANEDPILANTIVSRIVCMLINEAADTLHNQIASKEDIDTAMTKGVNYPKGLFAWADEIGIVECVKRIDALYDEYHEDRYRCSPLLRKMVKSATTFYTTNETTNAG